MNLLSKANSIFGKIIVICAVLSTITLIFLMLVNVLDVVMRWIGKPVYGVYELNSLLVGINIFLGLAYVQKTKKHMKVELLQGKGPPLFRRFISLFPALLGMVFFGWIGYIYFTAAIDSFQTNEVMSGIVQFPMYYLKFVMAIGIALLALQNMFDFLLQITEIVSSKKMKEQCYKVEDITKNIEGV